jgi:hypothetical protein
MPTEIAKLTLTVTKKGWRVEYSSPGLPDNQQEGAVWDLCHSLAAAVRDCDKAGWTKRQLASGKPTVLGRSHGDLAR